MQRRTPPFICPDIPGTGGAIKVEIDDFEVEEIATYLPSGEGDHLFLWVEKRDVSGFELSRRIARHFKVRKADVGMAGLKDRRAVTRQWVSIPGHTTEPEAALGPIDELVTILKAVPHQNKLKTGHLVGNQFNILIRGVTGHGYAYARAVVEFFNTNGIPNYYGPQRFGRGDETIALGLGLLDGSRSTRDKKLKRLALSSVQSAIFNETLIRRSERDALFRCLPGDILAKVIDDGLRRVEPGGENAATDRYQNRQVVPTGPMPGPKMTQAQYDVGEIETEAIEACEVDLVAFSTFKKLTRGSRRPIVSYSAEEITVEERENGLKIRFCLPAGSYATVPLLEIMKHEGVSE